MIPDRVSDQDLKHHSKLSLQIACYYIDNAKRLYALRYDSSIKPIKHLEYLLGELSSVLSQLSK